MIKKTADGLPVVNESTFIAFVKSYPIASPENDPEVTRRIERENPQIYRLLRSGMQNAPNKEARAYYECGVQITYELLRRQSLDDKV